MADLSRFEIALRNADAAGDVDAARALAGEIRRQRGAGVTEPNTSADVVKSFGTGLAEGAIGLAGVGDVRNLASKATDFVGGKLGATPEQLETFKGAAKKAALSNPLTAWSAVAPTSAEIQSKIEERTGAFHKPETTQGKYAQTVGNFIPASLAGLGGIVRRIGMQAVAPGLASEAAGQATAGTEAEPYARAGAALLTGAVGAPRAMPAGVTAADLKASAQQAYRDPSISGLVVYPSGPARMGRQAERAMETGGARRSFAGPAFSVTDELATLPNTQVGNAMRAAGLPPGATIADIKAVRTALGKVVEGGTDNLTGALNPTAGAAVTSRRKISEYLANIPAADVKSGDAAKAQRLLKQADADYAASKRAGTVESLVRRAELQAGSSNSGQNVNNATRQKLRQLLTNEKKTAGYTEAQKQQLERAVLGTKTGNAARFLGNFLAPSGALGLVPGAGVAGGAALLGANSQDAATLGVASALLGRGSRRIANSSTQKQSRKFQDMVVSNAPSYQKIKSTNSASAGKLTADQRRLAIAQALMSSQAAPRLYAPQQ